MPTLRPIEANRRNALKSTGPRTAAGKAVVTRNAVQHGIFCQQLLAEGDDPDELNRLIDGLLVDLAPRNFSERVLAERIISATWRLRRLAAAEAHLHESLAEDERDSLAESGRYPGEEADRETCEKIKGTNRQDKEWDRIEQRRREWADEQLCPAGLTLAIDLQKQHGSIERYSRYEKHLEGTIHRAWRELRLLRKDAEHQPPTPLVGEGGGEGEKRTRIETSALEEGAFEQGNRTREKSAPSTPHPDPLPQGEREPDEDATNIANIQNKPNSAASEDPSEVYAELPVAPVRPVPVVKSEFEGSGVSNDAEA